MNAGGGGGDAGDGSLVPDGVVRCVEWSTLTGDDNTRAGVFSGGVIAWDVVGPDAWPDGSTFSARWVEENGRWEATFVDSSDGSTTRWFCAAGSAGEFPYGGGDGVDPPATFVGNIEWTLVEGSWYMAT